MAAGTCRCPRRLAFFLHDRGEPRLLSGPVCVSAHRLTMTLLTVRHVTTYRYRKPVSFGEHRMMFRPRDSYDQKLLDARLAISPEPSDRALGARRVRQLRRHSRVSRDSEADDRSALREQHLARPLAVERARVLRSRTTAKTYPFAYSAEEMPDLLPAMTPRSIPIPTRPFDRWVRRFLRKGRPHRHRHAADDAHLRLQGELHLRAPHGARHPAARAHAQARPRQLPRPGAADDRGTALARPRRPLRLGLPLRAARATGRAIAAAAPRMPGAQVYLPGAGWVEFDPTNAIVGNRDLIRVAVARDPSQAVPLSGSYFGAARRLPRHDGRCAGPVGGSGRRACARRPRRRRSEPGVGSREALRLSVSAAMAPNLLRNRV